MLVLMALFGSLAVADEPLLPMSEGLDLGFMTVEMEGHFSGEMGVVELCELLASEGVATCTTTHLQALDGVTIYSSEKLPLPYGVLALEVGAKTLGYAFERKGTELVISAESVREEPQMAMVMVTPGMRNAEGMLDMMREMADSEGEGEAKLAGLLSSSLLKGAIVDEASGAIVIATGPVKRKLPRSTWITRESDTHFKVERQAVRELATAPNKAARPRDVRGGVGVTLGSTSRGVLYDLDLQRRDVLVAIDGLPVAGTDDIERLYRGFLTRDQVTVTLTRDSLPLVRVYDLSGAPVALPPKWNADTPTLTSRRFFAGIDEVDGVVVVPRHFMGRIAKTEYRCGKWRTHHGGDGIPDGMELYDAPYRGELDLLGLSEDSVLSKLEGKPVRTASDVADWFTALLGSEVVTATVDNKVVTWRLEGDPLEREWKAKELQTQPSIAEDREALGIRVEQGQLIVPRKVVLNKGRFPERLRVRPRSSASASYALSWQDRSYKELPLLYILGFNNGRVLSHVDGVPVTNSVQAVSGLEALFTADAVHWSVGPAFGRDTLGIDIRLEGKPVRVPDWFREQLDVDPTRNEARRTAGMVLRGEVWFTPASAMEGLQEALTALRVTDSGFRIGRLEAGSILDLLGLSSGDILVACNGEKLDSDASIAVVVAAFQGADPIELTVGRRRSEKAHRFRVLR